MESQENQYRWPKAEAVYPDRPGRSYALKRLRYRLRSFLHRGSIAHFEQFINQHPFLVTLLNEHADYSYPLVYRFLDKRFNSKQRFEAICDNLLFLPEKLTALSEPIYKTPLSFGEVIPDFEMTLSMTTSFGEVIPDFGEATDKNVPWFAPCLFDGGNDESIDESIGFQDVIGYSTKISK